MLLPRGSLTVEKDEIDSIIDVVFVQDSSEHGYEVMLHQNLPPGFVTPLKARILKFKFPLDLKSSKHMSRAAEQMCSDLHEACASVKKKRPTIIVTHKMMSNSNTTKFLRAIAREDSFLLTANLIGLICMESSRDMFEFPNRQRNVLAASQPTKSEVQTDIICLSDYFTLNSIGFEESVCEIEILSFCGRANPKVLIDTAVRKSPRFSTSGKEMYHLNNAIPAAEYIMAQILKRARDIFITMNPQMTAAKSVPSQGYQAPTTSHAIINWLSQSFQNLSPAPLNVLASAKNHGSGSWLLKRPEYIDWWHSDDRPIFWLSGSPGSGKSVLASYVIGSLKMECTYKTERPIVVPYFCDARYRASAPTAMVMREVISKLLSRQKQDRLRNRLQSLLTNLDGDDKRMSIGQLRTYFKEIQRAMAVTDTLILAFDGLDEVEEPEKSLVEELLFLIQNWNIGHRIKCFVSSNIFLGRTDITDSRQRIHLDDEVRARRDLFHFVTNEIEDIFQGGHFARYFYEKLTAHPEGIFCRAILALQDLRKIDTSNEAGVFSFINSMSPSLKSVLDDTLYRISESDRKISSRLFAFVTYTFRPLRISELLDVMDFDLRQVYPGTWAKSLSLCELDALRFTENDIPRLSGGLLTIAQDQTVQFVHRSVRFNIVAQNPKLAPENFCMNEDQAHEMLSRICLHFLKSWYDKSTSNIFENTKELDEFTGENNHEFTDYALQHWSNHFKISEQKSDHLQGLLQHLIQTTCQRSWIRYYGYSSTISKPAIRDSMRAALCIGTKVGSVKLVKILLEMGADPDRYIDFAGNNALHFAASYGHLSVVKLLLKQGARLDIPSGNNGRTPLQHAAAAGHISVMGLLLRTERALRKSKAKSVCENSPFRTIWVVCQSNQCSFRGKRKSITEYESRSTACGNQHGSNMCYPDALKRDQTWALPFRPLNNGKKDVENVYLNVPNQLDWISKSHVQQNSSNKGEDGRDSATEFLVQCLLENGISSVWQYSEACELQVQTLKHTEHVETLESSHLHLIFDTEDSNTITQNWFKSLKIAIDRRQEESIQFLLQNEAVAPPKIMSSFSIRFKNEGDYGYEVPQNPKYWKNSSVRNNTF